MPLVLALLAIPITTLGDDATSAAHNKPQIPPIITAFRNDAALNDITFVNPSSGWVVGDRGVIWHTDDGGKTWRQQASPVSCTLNAVYFLNSHRGWAVGGYCQPYTNATHGVVLRTDDGGTAWLRSPQPLLPLLTGVKFFDRDHGIAFGQSASYYPSGVFSTHDGGTTWQPLPADEQGNWFTGDFRRTRRRRTCRSGRPHRHARPPQSCRLAARRYVAPFVPCDATGCPDRRLGRRRRWPLTHDQRPGPQLANTPGEPASAGRRFRLPTLSISAPLPSKATTSGPPVRPARAFFTPPTPAKPGKPRATGQTAPIHALRFIDPQHGWATGALGNILTTHDGGQSWQTQRSGGAAPRYSQSSPSRPMSRSNFSPIPAPPTATSPPSTSCAAKPTPQSTPLRASPLQRAGIAPTKPCSSPAPPPPTPLGISQSHPPILHCRPTISSKHSTAKTMAEPSNKSKSPCSRTTHVATERCRRSAPAIPRERRPTIAIGRAVCDARRHRRIRRQRVLRTCDRCRTCPLARAKRYSACCPPTPTATTRSTLAISHHGSLQPSPISHRPLIASLPPATLRPPTPSS